MAKLGRSRGNPSMLITQTVAWHIRARDGPIWAHLGPQMRAREGPDAIPKSAWADVCVWDRFCFSSPQIQSNCDRYFRILSMKLIFTATFHAVI